MFKTEFYSSDPLDYIRVALAIETLAYHDKNYLHERLRNDARISEVVQSLLVEAIKQAEKKG